MEKTANLRVCVFLRVSYMGCVKVFTSFVCIIQLMGRNLCEKQNTSHQSMRLAVYRHFPGFLFVCSVFYSLWEQRFWHNRWEFWQMFPFAKSAPLPARVGSGLYPGLWFTYASIFSLISLIEMQLKIKAIYSMEILISMVHHNFECLNDWLVFSSLQAVIPWLISAWWHPAGWNKSHIKPIGTTHGQKEKMRSWTDTTYSYKLNCQLLKRASPP